jgi:amidophosphoribosyltransferase
VAYVYDGGGLRRGEVDLVREAEKSLRGVAAVGCVSPDGGCCAEFPGGVRCGFSGTYVELGRDGVLRAKRGAQL